MSAIILPEVTIFYTTQAILKFLRDDLATHTDTETYLYKIFGGVDRSGQPMQINTYNFFTQTKKMLQNPNALKISYGYNPETAKGDIALHIILPSERDGGSSIGEGEGYLDTPLNRCYSQRMASTYQVMITSVNMNETLAIYHLLKATFLAVTQHWELRGLEMVKFSGNDIVFESDLVPNMIFHKVLNLEFSYELTVPQIFQLPPLETLEFEGTPINYNTGERLPADIEQTEE